MSKSNIVLCFIIHDQIWCMEKVNIICLQETKKVVMSENLVRSLWHVALWIGYFSALQKHLEIFFWCGTAELRRSCMKPWGCIMCHVNLRTWGINCCGCPPKCMDLISLGIGVLCGMSSVVSVVGGKYHDVLLCIVGMLSNPTLWQCIRSSKSNICLKGVSMLLFCLPSLINRDGWFEIFSVYKLGGMHVQNYC